MLNRIFKGIMAAAVCSVLAVSLLPVNAMAVEAEELGEELLEDIEEENEEGEAVTFGKIQFLDEYFINGDGSVDVGINVKGADYDKTTAVLTMGDDSYTAVSREYYGINCVKIFHIPAAKVYENKWMSATVKVDGKDSEGTGISQTLDISFKCIPFKAGLSGFTDRQELLLWSKEANVYGYIPYDNTSEVVGADIVSTIDPSVKISLDNYDGGYVSSSVTTESYDSLLHEYSYDWKSDFLYSVREIYGCVGLAGLKKGNYDLIVKYADGGTSKMENVFYCQYDTFGTYDPMVICKDRYNLSNGNVMLSVDITPVLAGESELNFIVGGVQYTPVSSEMGDCVRYECQIPNMTAGNHQVKITGELTDGWHESITFNKTVTITAAINVQDAAAAIHGESITLNGDIGVNFYYSLSDDVINNKDAYFVRLKSSEGKEVISQIPSPVYRDDNNDGLMEKYFCFTYRVEAKQMSDVISVTFFKNGLPIGTTTEYSVADYCKNKKSSSGKLADLAVKMANYGAYSQKFFNYKIGQLANAGMDLTAYNSELAGTVIADPKHLKKAGRCTGIQPYAASLILDSLTTLRYYFLIDEGLSPGDFIFECNGETLKAGNANVPGMYYVDVKDVAASELDSIFTVTVYNHAKTESAAISYSGVQYMYSMKDRAELKDLLKAMYLYNKSANAYFS